MSAAAPPVEAAAAPPKSKKWLFIVLGLVAVLLLAAVAAFFILKANTADEDDDLDEAPAAAKVERAARAPAPGTPPTFLPLDSMVVNLADPGGNRYAQLGITLQVQDNKTGDELKLYMPSIRNGILILVSQRTAADILALQGKEKLAQDIMAEISNVMGYPYEAPDDSAAGKPRRRAPASPLQGVLFSSFIVQ